MTELVSLTRPRGGPYAKQTMLDGYPARIQCVNVAGHTFMIRPGLASTVCLEEEWYEDLADPRAVIDALRGDPPADLFTFWQRPPDLEARHDFHTEWEELAVLTIESYDQWWSHQVKPQVRNKVRKATKAGLSVEEVAFDDEFVAGMTRIFNESPVRQGRRFWHYGKDFATVKAQFSRCIFRERMIGAYFNGEMIGFVMLANAGHFAIPGQIIASLHHRDKGVSNALMAKSVELCAQQGLRSIIYMYWGDDTLADFKRANGFEPVRVPRYWVPLTARGRAALAVGAHRGLKTLIPPRLKAQLKDVRRQWYERRSG
jgi:hypothetical protein